MFRTRKEEKKQTLQQWLWERREEERKKERKKEERILADKSTRQNAHKIAHDAFSERK